MKHLQQYFFCPLNTVLYRLNKVCLLLWIMTISCLAQSEPGALAAKSLTEPQEIPWNKVRDHKLQQCLEGIAEKNSWVAAADFTEIKCHSKKIKVVDGIDQFTHVTSISLYNNAIEAFPAYAFPLLRSLNLAKNEMTSLDIRHYPALEDLYLFKNKLHTLHISALPLLSQIKANSNKISNFSYEDLPTLEKVYMFDNAMEHIDIYSLPKLKYMDVRQNPMPDELYEEMDDMNGVTILHDGNADDWN